MTKGKLYMIPTYLAETTPCDTFPAANADVVKSVRHYVVENARTARRFLKSIDKSIDIDSLTMSELSEHSVNANTAQMLAAAENGEDVAMVSEAGCPGVADPGADLAAEAHRKGIQVVPLVGPSSLLMSLMASGLNGQNFAFSGYLPIGSELTKALRKMEDRSQKEKQTQIFIEAPYRNDKMLQTLLQTLKAETRLCVARDIMGPEELILTKRVADWRKTTLPELHKRPTVFLFLA
ncbi:MAG: SAM-dependent methyltransferase [Bacteroidales bacterium]|nr:SAM-dependent methyltransferase [Bacteroidales bacterium]MDD7725243.1 SAM-dependent methyltransferase [Bacteroidales bacterium]MDY4175590.1 SAM-dependent methyltransferase [Bacteroidales bacterium]